MKARTVSPAAEVKRLRRDLAGLRRGIAALLAAQTVDPDAEFRAGWDACLDRFAGQIGGRIYPAHPTELEMVRYHVCCAGCRRDGHRAGCVRCVENCRETFGQPHPDDFPGQQAGSGVAA